MLFSETGRRVLGCLVEKALATPQQYPLSANALTNACNQSTGRHPVVSWDVPTAMTGVDDLKKHQLIKVEYARGSHTPKYMHQLQEQLDLATDQQAVLAVLLLRGPQTVGELRQRTDRLHPFGSLDEVESTLTSLAEHKFGGLVTALARQPGQKEIRWTHVLASEKGDTAPPAEHLDAATAGDILPDSVPAANPTALTDRDTVGVPPVATPVDPPADLADALDRIDGLEVRVDALEAQLADALDALDRALG